MKRHKRFSVLYIIPYQSFLFLFIVGFQPFQEREKDKQTKKIPTR